MPKRVKSLVATDVSSLSNNELVIIDSGLGMKYDDTVYEFNGNKKMMQFIKDKQSMGEDNKEIETTKNLDSEGNVPEITDETGVYLLNEQ